MPDRRRRPDDDVLPHDVLDAWDRERREARRPPPEVEAVPGLVVTHRATSFRGAVATCHGDAVELRRGDGTVRLFALERGGFLREERPVTLVLPRRWYAEQAARTAAPRTTASGSVAVPGAPARVARAGRILVEGVHDAELVEQVWGDDLRVEGVVVERLDGIDHLAGWLRAFRPDERRRVGVLVDHLVPHSKEARIAEEVRGPGVLVTGTPYVDVWQAVRPHRVGLERWPDIPRGTDWKTGICAVLGEPEPALVWRRLKAAVRSYADLEPALVGAVEQLIDFVTGADPG